MTGGQEQQPEPASKLPSDELSKDVELTRAELADTLSELEHRLSPRKRAGDVAYRSAARAQRAGTDVGEYLRGLRENPARKRQVVRIGGTGATVLVGVLVLWGVLRGRGNTG